MFISTSCGANWEREVSRLSAESVSGLEKRDYDYTYPSHGHYRYVLHYFVGSHYSLVVFGSENRISCLVGCLFRRVGSHGWRPSFTASRQSRNAVHRGEQRVRGNHEGRPRMRSQVFAWRSDGPYAKQSGRAGRCGDWFQHAYHSRRAVEKLYLGIRRQAYYYRGQGRQTAGAAWRYCICDCRALFYRDIWQLNCPVVWHTERAEASGINTPGSCGTQTRRDGTAAVGKSSS